MPTSRARHSVTETDAVERALDAAARRWPHERRGRLLLRLIEEGHRALQAEDDADAGRRAAAVRETEGALTGVYPEGYLAGLRDAWAP